MIEFQQGFVGALVLAYVIMAFSTDLARKKSQKVRDFFEPITLDKLVSDRAKWWLMVFFSIAAFFVYLYCFTCGETEEVSTDSPEVNCFGLAVMFKDLLGIIPWFVWGCVVAGFILKQMHQELVRGNARRYPRRSQDRLALRRGEGANSARADGVRRI